MNASAPAYSAPARRAQHDAHYTIHEALASLAESPREIDGDLNEAGFPELARALAGWTGLLAFSRLPLHGAATTRLWLEDGCICHAIAGDLVCVTEWEVVEALTAVQLAEAGNFDLDPFATTPAEAAGGWRLEAIATAVAGRSAAVLALAAQVPDVRDLYRWTALRCDPASVDDPALARFIAGSSTALLAGADAATLARRQGISLRQAMGYLALLVRHGSVEPFEAAEEEFSEEPLDGVTWFYRDAAGAEAGPVLDRELFGLVRRGDVAGEALVWRNGQSMWMPYRTARTAALRERALKATAMLRQSPCASCGKVFREAAMTLFNGHLLCAPCRHRFVAAKPHAPETPEPILHIPLTASLGARLRKLFGR